MATARQTGASLLGTITNTANMLSSTVNVLADSVEMAHSYVNKHRTMQVKKNLIELDNYNNVLIKETAKANLERDEQIDDFLSKKETRRDKYIAECTRLDKLLNPSNYSSEA